MTLTSLTLDLKWFRFSQNNSGGYFVTDENVCEEVFIQARTAAEAEQRGEPFLDNSDSCPCCGDRWSSYIDDSDGHDEPMYYDEPLTAVKASWGRKQARLHHFDGRIETVKFPEATKP